MVLQGAAVIAVQIERLGPFISCLGFSDLNG